MRTFLAACGCVLIVTLVSAQQAPPSAGSVKVVASSSDVAAIVARLKAQPPQPLRSAPLLQLAPLISHRFPLSRAAEAYAMIEARPEEVTQVLFTYAGESAA